MEQTQTEREQPLVQEVLADFERRRDERRWLERSWQLNMNFVHGNQYCDINLQGEIEEVAKPYYWQSRRVFNYIAPTLDTRIAKLDRIRPALVVRSATEQQDDIQSSQMASALLKSVAEEQDLNALIAKATTWSETCGTAFYKVVWDNDSGTVVGVTEEGKPVKDGDVKIVVLSPFEIYPSSLSIEEVQEQPSIIHAKAMAVADIQAIYGVELPGRDVDEFALSPFVASGYSTVGNKVGKSAVKHGYELVVERYERPTPTYPNGRLVIVAGDRLVYDGDMPYYNALGEREYPFIKQVCLPSAGSFFGQSIVERLIPIQRAYNAIKNRKHEFLNRLSMGTIAVEDGSVDIDELEEEGLVPGKILVYRQGGQPPEMLSLGSVPSAFGEEEKTLQQEFYNVSAVGDLVRNADSFASVTSATGLQLIIEQDDARLNTTYSSIKGALKALGKHVLHLYHQFASDVRLKRSAGANGDSKVFYFKGSDITSDDVTLMADSDVNLTQAQRRNVIYEMLDKGLFTDENGNLPQETKQKILEELGYGNLLTPEQN